LLLAFSASEAILSPDPFILEFLIIQATHENENENGMVSMRILIATKDTQSLFHKKKAAKPTKIPRLQKLKKRIYS